MVIASSAKNTTSSTITTENNFNKRQPPAVGGFFNAPPHGTPCGFIFGLFSGDMLRLDKLYHPRRVA